MAAKAKELEDAQKTESERLTEQLQALKAEAATAKAETLRLRVAAETGLPADLHEFLVGDDEESLRAKAEKLMAATAPAERRTPAPDPTQGAKPGAHGPMQATQAELDAMTPDQVLVAKREGRLNTLLGIK